jgi:autotransporter-associated beta strand protein
MTSATWRVSAHSLEYNDSLNWNTGATPGASDTAFFGTSDATTIDIPTNNSVGEWVFNPGAFIYTFTNETTFTLAFFGAGIVVNGGAVHINNLGTVGFTYDSTAGSAIIANAGLVVFAAGSSGGSANIANNNEIDFKDNSSAGSATITNFAAGTVDFSQSVGPAGNDRLTAGSIAGAGTYKLGADQLTVLSGNVGGLIDDSGLGGSLVKVGKGTLKLSGAANAYSGGTTIEQGALDLAAVGAAGTGGIKFQGAGKELKVLKIENGALSGHVFTTNNIDFFAQHDVLDLTGLKFHAGASASYHTATHHLTVHSGSITDTLTLLSPHGIHFEAANDHHGGTEVFLVFA